MITFQTLEWGNLFSYGASNKIKLNNAGVTQLVGLNGHGKSSVPLILEETLFNKNSKGTKRQDVLNRNTKEKHYWTKLIFDISGVPYQLETKRSSTHSIKLIENGVDISGHTATQTLAKIEDLMGYEFKNFSQIVYQNSGSSLQFLTATDTNRKKFLIDLLSLDKYVEMFETLKAHHKVVADKLLVVKATHNSTKEWLDKYSKEVLELLPLQDVPKFPEELTTKLSDKKKELLKVDHQNEKIFKNLQYKKLRDSIEIPASVGARVDTSSSIKEEATLLQKLKNAKQMAAKIKSLGDNCPTCLQSITPEFKTSLLSVEETTLEVDAARLKVVTSELEKATINNTKVSKNEKALLEFEKYSSLVDTTLLDTLQDKEELEKECSTLQSQLANVKLLIQQVESLNNKAIDHNSRVRTILSQLDSYKQKLTDTAAELDKLSEETSYLDVLKKAFSTNGLLAYKIEASVKELETLSNFYLTELSYGRFQISYMINNDKLNVVITDNGKDITVEALSAGELARVTTSTLLAIRKLMSKIAKNRINVLFLDETIDTLDSDGKEKLIELLLAEPELNVFLVSHGYTHPLLDKVTVVKENGVSRLEE